jgi:hypothetical protein
VPASTDHSINFVQTISTHKAILAGDDFIAQIELSEPSKPPMLVPDPRPTGNIRWLSPREKTQIAVGDGTVIRLLPFSESLALLRAAEGQDFRRTAANPVTQAALESIPELSEYRYNLKKILDDAAQIEARDKSIHVKLLTLSESKEKDMGQEPITSTEYLWWLNGSRALALVITFFAIRFLSSLYRYHLTLSNYYLGLADALRMIRIVPDTVAELTAIFVPKSLEDVAPASMIDELLRSAKGILGAQPKS